MNYDWTVFGGLRMNHPLLKTVYLTPPVSTSLFVSSFISYATSSPPQFARLPALRPPLPSPSFESELLIESMRPNTREERRKKEEREGGRGAKSGRGERGSEGNVPYGLDRLSQSLRPTQLSQCHGSAVALGLNSKEVKGWRPRGRG